MDKKLIKGVLAVLLGISVFTVLGAAVSLMFDAILADDLLLVSSVSETTERIIAYIKNTSVAIVCIAVPSLVATCMACFAKSKKVFGILSALANLLLAVVCIAFLFDLRVIALADLSATAYAAAAEYFAKLITVAVPALILCAFLTGTAVRAFMQQKRTPEAGGEVTHEEN